MELVLDRGLEAYREALEEALLPYLGDGPGQEAEVRLRGGLEGAVVKVEVRAGGRRQTVFALPLAHLLWEGA